MKKKVSIKLVFDPPAPRHAEAVHGCRPYGSLFRSPCNTCMYLHNFCLDSSSLLQIESFAGVAGISSSLPLNLSEPSLLYSAALFLSFRAITKPLHDKRSRLGKDTVERFTNLDLRED